MVNDNFGDVIQAKYWVDFYKQLGLEVLFICYPQGKNKCQKILKLKENEIRTTSDFFSETNIQAGILHLYGGGYLNAMWGGDFIPIIEFAYKNNIKIIATGVQVDETFLEKSKDHYIQYLSVRDQKSCNLTDCNLVADDSFAYFLSRKLFYDIAYFMSNIRLNRKVLLQINMNSYVFDDQDLGQYMEVLRSLIRDLSEFYQIEFASSFPLDITDIQENKILVDKLGLNPEQYKYSISKQLDNRIFGGYELIIVNSFHTYLMLINKYCCPVYYLAYSKYYQQKALGLRNYGLLPEDRLITKFEDLSRIPIQKIGSVKVLSRDEVTTPLLMHSHVKKKVMSYLNEKLAEVKTTEDR